ncbi:MAG: metallophosphoesterase [Spirochaetaceae bacterium]|jgi:hypothetical protein|nr:metallophosphoesterase [Spirochaetaceae bacterium]
MRLAIGDIHGRSFWKHYLDEDYTEYYILGDYFDSFDIPFKVQLKNFLEITEVACRDTRIKLCWGNHDFHYFLNDPRERYSGYQNNYAQKIYETLCSHKKLLNVVYTTEDNILISHAGISNTFLREAELNAPEDINSAFAKNPAILSFNGVEPYGDEIQQGPLWIRPNSLISDACKGYSQIVGHTVIREITTIELDEAHNKGCTITFIDTHDRESIYRF